MQRILKINKINNLFEIKRATLKGKIGKISTQEQQKEEKTRLFPFTFLNWIRLKVPE